MNFTKKFLLTLKGTVTPADPLSGEAYYLGWNGYSFTIPAEANAVITRTLGCSTTGRVWEPDINSFNGVTQPDADGITVSLNRLYVLALQNKDTTHSVNFVCANMDAGNHAGTLRPGGISIIFYPNVGVTNGITIGSTSTITLTASSGAPNVDGFIIGRYV